MVKFYNQQLPFNLIMMFNLNYYLSYLFICIFYNFIDDRNDWRISKRQSFYENLYKICVQDREETLRKWYNAHIKIDNL